MLFYYFIFTHFSKKVYLHTQHHDFIFFGEQQARRRHNSRNTVQFPQLILLRSVMSASIPQKPKLPPKPSRPSLTPIHDSLKSIPNVGSGPETANTNPFADESDDYTAPPKSQPPPPPPQPPSIPPPPIPLAAPTSQAAPGGNAAAPILVVGGGTRHPVEDINGSNPMKPLRKFGFTADVEQPGVPRDADTIYHKNHYSSFWMVTAVILHSVQFTVMLTMGYNLLSGMELGIIIGFVVATVGALFLSRVLISKTPRPMGWLAPKVSKPEEEWDGVPDTAIYALSLAAMFEGVAFALFPAMTADMGENQLNSKGFYSSSTIVQTLSFATITFYCLHRSLRPANRLDPLRTVLEVSFLLSLYFSYMYQCDVALRNVAA